MMKGDKEIIDAFGGDWAAKSIVIFDRQSLTN